MYDSHTAADINGARPIVQPPVDELLAKVDSRFTLCTLAAKRSRQITDMINGALGDRGALADIDAGQIRTLTAAKPLTLALDEILSGDVSPARASNDNPVSTVDVNSASSEG